MAGSTVLVQGIPESGNYRRSSCATHNHIQKDVEFLTQLFSKFGPTQCTLYCPTIEGTKEGFAYVTFRNVYDTLRALNASRNNELRINGQMLTLTLMSNDGRPIDILNDDCLIRVFSMLDKKDKLTIEKVCKRWELLGVKSWASTRSLCLAQSYTSESDTEQYILRCGRYLRRLIFTTAHHSTVLLAKEYCKNLQSLEILFGFNKNLTNEWLENFRDMFRSLSKLKFLILRNIDSNIPFDFVDDVSKDIEEIHCFGTRNLVSTNFSRLLHLRSVTLVKVMINEGAFQGIQRLTNLSRVKLCGSYVHSSNVESMKNLTNLKELLIAECNIQDDQLINIVVNNNNLEVLDLGWIQSLTDRSLTAVFKLAKLRSLKIRHLTHITLNITNAMPELQIVDCHGCPEVTNDGLCSLVQLCSKLHELNILKCHNVSSAFLRSANELVKARNSGIGLTIFTNINEGIENDEQSPLLKIHSFPLLHRAQRRV